MTAAKGLRIAYMGTPQYAVGPLSALHASAHEVVCVYTRAPKPRGRGHNIQPSPVHDWANEYGIPVRHPKSLKDADIQAEFAALGVDAAVVVAYGLLLPDTILNAPKFGCINLHPSLLPRWRGAAPIQRCMLAGETETGMSIMQLDAGMDTGPVIAQEKRTIGPEETALDLHNDLFDMGERMLVEVLDKAAKTGTLETTKQDDAQACYADKLEKAEGLVSLHDDTAATIHLKLRALTPWPGIWIETGGKRLKIIKATVLEARNAKPGTILDKDGSIACAEGTVLRLETVQPEGKAAMDTAAWMNGMRLKPGDRV